MSPDSKNENTKKDYGDTEDGKPHSDFFVFEDGKQIGYNFLKVYSG